MRTRSPVFIKFRLKEVRGIFELLEDEIFIELQYMT
jgi:hypothetical protein